MNDRFKCRVWNKKLNRMEEVISIGIFRDPFERLAISTDTEDGQIWYYGNDCDNILLMQCTGFVDKNNKLLFWDDIVKDDFGRIFIIQPCKGAFELQSIKLFKDGGYHKDSCYNYTMYSETAYEIIDNIHENPALLEIK